MIYKDNKKHQIVLTSQSTQDYPPIYIHEEDSEGYAILGTAKHILKKPIMSWQD